MTIVFAKYVECCYNLFMNGGKEMKKLFKLLAVFAITLALTGCVKVRYQINITDEDNADVNMTILYSKEMMDTYNMSQEDIKEQLLEDENLKDWDLVDVSEKIDGEEYAGFKATAPKDVSKELLEGLNVEGNKYTLKLEGSEFDDTINTDEFDQLGYSVEQLEKMGLEFNIKISMPGKIKSSSIGEVKDNVVTIGLTDLEKLSDDIVIVSESSSSSSNLGLIIGAIAVVVVVGAGAFYFFKKKNKTDEYK